MLAMAIATCQSMTGTGAAPAARGAVHGMMREGGDACTSLKVTQRRWPANATGHAPDPSHDASAAITGSDAVGMRPPCSIR